jgi:hypothetical protein
LTLTTFTIEISAVLYGRQFWQRGKVETFILFLGAAIALVLAVVEALGS